MKTVEKSAEKVVEKPVEKPAEPVEVEFFQTHVPTGKIDVLTHSVKEGASYRRAFNATGSEDIRKQLVWLIEFWNAKIPEVWKYEIAE